MDEKMKELLDVYERFGKDAQNAIDFALRNADRMGCAPVEFDLTAMPLAKAGEPEYRAVDLGLPSGRLWCDRNVGARSPEDCGLYFSWGNIEGEEQGKMCEFSEEGYAGTPGAEIDGDIEADGGFDAARENMGDPWRMPTEADFVELDKYCTREWTAQDRYFGMKFTSKKNGNSIFMPASGYGSGSSWYLRGSSGYYWSSTFYSARYARYLIFYSGGVFPQDDNSRYYGFAVRAVQN